MRLTIFSYAVQTVNEVIHYYYQNKQEENLKQVLLRARQTRRRQRQQRQARASRRLFLLAFLYCNFTVVYIDVHVARMNVQYMFSCCAVLCFQNDKDHEDRNDRSDGFKQPAEPDQQGGAGSEYALDACHLTFRVNLLCS